MKRPVGITALALISFAMAITFIVTAMLFASVPHILAPLGFKQDPQPLQRLFGLSFFAVVGILLAHTGYSLWFLRPWGRSFAIGVAWAGLVVAVEKVFRGSSGYFEAGLIFLGCVGFLWYLSLPRVRSSFEAIGRGN